jgi:DNA modification methylase
VSAQDVIEGRADWHVECADCLAWLPTLPAGCVQTVVTSPPYFALRDYGTAKWEGGEAGCDHKGKPHATRTGFNERYFGRPSAEGNMQDAVTEPVRGDCHKCGARRIDSQLGLEKTPELYVERMVEVFRAVWRVLRDDGTMWINLGDSYCNAGTRNQGTGLDGKRRGGVADTDGSWESAKGTYRDIRHSLPGIKHKDLIGMPWLLAFALRADGWYLRSDCVWSKPNPMPESVQDRPTKSHEYVFLLTKQARYYYDAEAIRKANQAEPHSPGYTSGAAYAVGPMDRGGHSQRESPDRVWGASGGRNRRTVWTADDHTALVQWLSVNHPDLLSAYLADAGNKGDVWDIPTEPYKGAHFATFPCALVEPCLKAGTSARGACSVCGAPWRRVVERERLLDGQARVKGTWSTGAGHPTLGAQGVGHNRITTTNHTTGWQPSCKCGPAPTVPCVVLDMFCGSGTVGAVARRLGLRFIGSELSEPYADLARERITTALRDDLRAGPARPGPTLFDLCDEES